MERGFNCSNPICTVILQPDEHSTVAYCPECGTWHIKVEGEWVAHSQATRIDEEAYKATERKGIQEG